MLSHETLVTYWPLADPDHLHNKTVAIRPNTPSQDFTISHHTGPGSNGMYQCNSLEFCLNTTTDVTMGKVCQIMMMIKRHVKVQKITHTKQNGAIKMTWKL